MRRRRHGKMFRLTLAERRRRAARNDRRGRGAVPAGRRAWRPKVERERLTISQVRKRLRALRREWSS